MHVARRVCVRRVSLRAVQAQCFARTLNGRIRDLCAEVNREQILPSNWSLNPELLRAGCGIACVHDQRENVHVWTPTLELDAKGCALFGEVLVCDDRKHSLFIERGFVACQTRHFV